MITLSILKAKWASLGDAKLDEDGSANVGKDGSKAPGPLSFLSLAV